VALPKTSQGQELSLLGQDLLIQGQNLHEMSSRIDALWGQGMALMSTTLVNNDEQY